MKSHFSILISGFEKTQRVRWKIPAWSQLAPTRDSCAGGLGNLYLFLDSSLFNGAPGL